MVVKEDHVNGALVLAEHAVVIQPLDALRAGGNHDADCVPQTCEVNEAGGDGREKRVLFDAEIPLAPGLAHGVAEHDGRITHVAAEFEDGGGFVARDDAADDGALGLADVDEPRLGAGKGVDGVEDCGGVAAQLGEGGVVVDVVEEGDLAAVVELGLSMLVTLGIWKLLRLLSSLAHGDGGKGALTNLPSTSQLLYALALSKPVDVAKAMVLCRW